MAAEDGNEPLGLDEESVSTGQVPGQAPGQAPAGATADSSADGLGVNPSGTSLTEFTGDTPGVPLLAMSTAQLSNWLESNSASVETLAAVQQMQLSGSDFVYGFDKANRGEAVVDQMAAQLGEPSLHVVLGLLAP